MDETKQVAEMQESTVNVQPESAEPTATESAVEPLTLEDISLEELEAMAEDPPEGTATGGDAVDAAALASYQVTIAQLEDHISSLKTQLEERNGQYARIYADFENYRKRVQRDQDDQEVRVKIATINELLPVIDNFERARAQIKPSTEAETNIHKSYQSVYKQLVDCLKRIGVAPMRAEGKEFDPNLHEAVMRQPTHEYEEGIVMEELQRGYMLGDRVLRHALVKVAAASEAVVASEDSAADSADS